MPYAQKGYLEIQGTNGKYRIDQIGCYLTAFSNLLERFGTPVSPVDLNRIFKERNIFIDVDDGIKDDLGWQSVTAYDGQVVVSQIGGVGWPSNNNSIVRFKYKGKAGFTTHFCLVVDAANHKIIDSYDGQTKDGQARYGTPTGWASYIKNTPQPVTPPPAPAPPVDSRKFIIVQAGWGISHVAKAAGYPDWREGSRWDAIAQLNGHANASDFHMKPDMKVFVDEPVVAAPVPVAVPEPTPAPPAVPVTPEPAPVEPGTVITPDPAPEAVETPEPPKDYKDTYEVEIVDYTATATVIVKDMEGLNPDTRLDEGLTVHGAGTFTKDGILYVRTRQSVASGRWYGVPYTALEKVSGSEQVVDPNNEDSIFDIHLKDELDDFIKETGKSLKSGMSLKKKFIALIGYLSGLFKKNKKET